MTEIEIKAICSECGEDVDVKLFEDGSVFAGWGHGCFGEKEASTRVAWVHEEGVDMLDGGYDARLSWGGE